MRTELELGRVLGVRRVQPKISRPISAAHPQLNEGGTDRGQAGYPLVLVLAEMTRRRLQPPLSQYFMCQVCQTICMSTNCLSL